MRCVRRVLRSPCLVVICIELLVLQVIVDFVKYAEQKLALESSKGLTGCLQVSIDENGLQSMDGLPAANRSKLGSFLAS